MSQENNYSKIYGEILTHIKNDESGKLVPHEYAVRILKEKGIPHFFIPYGNNYDNNGVVKRNNTGQATLNSNAIKALTEQITNMTDSTIERIQLEKGINPKDPLAVPSVKEAVMQTIGPHYLNYPPKSRRKDLKLAHQDFIPEIIFTGGAIPDVSLLDWGTGQLSEDFAKTFLSLNASNKKDKKGSTGKYNQGAIVVSRFCERGYLLASRHHSKSECWSFTIVRVGEDHCVEYLVIGESDKPKQGKVMVTDLENITYYSGKHTRQENTKDFGTYIKLFGYDAVRSVSNVQILLIERLSKESFFNANIPIAICDLRVSKDKKEELFKKYTKEGFRGNDITKKVNDYVSTHSNYSFLWGNMTRWRDAGDEGKLDFVSCKENIPLHNEEGVFLGTFNLDVIVVKEEFRGVKQNPNSLCSSLGTVSLNGQIQGKVSSTLLSNNRDIAYIYKHIKFNADLSNLSDSAQYNLLQSDRENISKLGEKLLLPVIKKIILEDEDILRINIEREEAINKKSEDLSEMTKELLPFYAIYSSLKTRIKYTLSTKIGTISRSIGKKGISKNNNKNKKIIKKIFKGKTIPTIFELRGPSLDKDNNKYINVNLADSKRATIFFKTDAANGFIFNNLGNITISVPSSGLSLSEVVLTADDTSEGIYKFSINKDTFLNIFEEDLMQEFVVRMSTDSVVLTEEFYILFNDIPVVPKNSGNNDKSNKANPLDDVAGSSDKVPDEDKSFEPPNVTLLGEEHEFDVKTYPSYSEDEGVSSQEDYAHIVYGKRTHVFVNMDNINLLEFIKDKKRTDKEYFKKWWITTIQLEAEGYRDYDPELRKKAINTRSETVLLMNEFQTQRDKDRR